MHNFFMKPIPVEAAQFEGTDESAQVIALWIRANSPDTEVRWMEDGSYLMFTTPSGLEQAEPGDWVVRDPDNEFRVVLEALFPKFYDQAPSDG